VARFHKSAVGKAQLIALQDGWAQIPAAMFFPSVDAGKWDGYRQHLDEGGNITLNLGSWLVVSEGKTILVDTGLGGRPTQMPLKIQPALPSVMTEAGVKPADVDVVLFTHLHFDHTGWNTVDEGGRPVPVFPNARHVVQRREWEYWTRSEENRTAAQYANALAPLEAAGLVDFVEGEHAVTSELLTVPTPGHTPGHVSFLLASDGERAYIAGDATHHPVQASEPGWCPGADINPDDSARSRRALFDRVEAEGALLAGGHYAFPGLGNVETRDGKRRFVPIS
jgi:glyoxylase-like metal-dependent hydrolase (beta-lactamase superfamily II)